MKIWVFSFMWNEARMLPFYLRHYAAFAEKIILFDDAQRSDDGSRELAESYPAVEVMDCPFSGIDDDSACRFAIGAMSIAASLADWIIWPDIDEFIWAQDINEILSWCQDSGYAVARSYGYNMTGNGVPDDDGRQIYELRPTGIDSIVYSKPIVIRSGTKVAWSLGRHRIEWTDGRCTPKPVLKLLHYRYLGSDYTKERNRRNYDRSVCKNHAWTNVSGYQGVHSEHWASEVADTGFNVLKHEPTEQQIAVLQDVTCACL